MNGIPVCLERKTENAPTWRSPSPLFGGGFRALFRHILDHSVVPIQHHQQTKYILFVYVVGLLLIIIKH